MTDGRIDTAAWAAAARTVPGVVDAEAVVRHRRRVREPAPGPVFPPLPGGPAPVRPPALVRGEGAGPGPGWPATLGEALHRAAERYPDRGTTYVLDDGSTDRQTYAQLLADARRVLGGLRALGLVPGSSVLLQLPGSRDFVTVFWACVLGGFLPTPVPVAPTYRDDNATTRKLYNAWKLLDRPPVVTDAEHAPEIAKLTARWERAATVAVAGELRQAAPDLSWHRAAPDEAVLNLLTSGSTGIPKCVRHPHRTLAARTWATAVTNGFGPQDVALNWMPLDHVGGIVMWNMRDVFLGCEHVNATTAAFLARPTRWLEWTDRFQATNTWAPNFAFAMVNAAADEVGRGAWDLSSLRHITNAGEAVVPRTARRFLELCAPHGLPADAMVPCWGMSETSSGVTYARMHRDDPATGSVTVDPRSLQGDLALLAPGTTHAVTFTDVGAPIGSVALRIVDERGDIVPEARIGRLQITGATVTPGYHRNPEANGAAFTDDGWFDTGDMGFLLDGRLALTGRRQDLIIVNGANYPSHELEAVAGAVPGVGPAHVAACAVPGDGQAAPERVAVFFVPADDDPDGHRATCTAITAALARESGVRPDLVVPVERGAFPRTDNGKIQRRALVEALARGDFDERLAEAGPQPAGPKPSLLATRIWQPLKPSAPPADPRGTVVVLADGGLGPALAARLHGARVVTVGRGGSYARTGPSSFVVDPCDRGQYLRLFGEAARDAADVTVVHAWGLTGTGGPDPAASVLWCLQALRADRPHGRAELLVVTAGTYRVRACDRGDGRHGALHGLVRTAAQESTLHRTRHLDLGDPAGRGEVDFEAAAGAIAVFLTEFADDRHHEPVVAERDGAFRVPRLREVAEPDGLAGCAMVRPGGTYLITGGLGGIGRHLAEYLLAACQARLLLVGRRPPKAAAAHLADLAALGEVRYAALDVADGTALAAAVTEAETAWGRPLDGMFHLAGQAAGEAGQTPLLADETAEGLHAHAHAKVGGAQALDALLEDRPDTELVLFSSVLGFFGCTSLGAYAAANSALDTWAEQAAARGRRVRSIAWGMWRDTGMNAADAAAQAGERRGILNLDPGRALAALLAALALDTPYVMVGADPHNPQVQQDLDTAQLERAEVVVAVAPGDPAADPATLTAAVREALPRTVRSRVLTVPRLPAEPARRQETVLRAAAPGPARPQPRQDPQGPWETAVAELWSRVLNSGTPGRDQHFFELGGDSLRAIHLMRLIDERFATGPAVRTLYENPTVRGLASAIERTHQEQTPCPTSP
ncbi:SDR family NAD(P)-dependent oxidoreductase [Streptomyces sp. NPDC005760]|uniref:SDR family NAD(P)-dependent oxidoreductase n=1 Tax=Streptomyces sp. NPDC005760 TaxID=3156718 RepID=UPI0033D1F031